MSLSVHSWFLNPIAAQDAPQIQKSKISNQKSAIPPRNRLASSKSPYLLQHADNPVAWYPWGEEAFAKARTENKPVFLSIGYSTCHWCHVMEHESFEDIPTADYLNRHFVPIKVDREERPDIDRIYMNYQQAVHGGGGWPLSVWLTPERVPFFSGTYFPREPRPGSTTFMEILSRVHETWEKHHADIGEDSARILARMKEVFSAPPGPDTRPGAVLTPQLSANAFSQLASSFDPQFGGFGRRPKFPQPVLLNFLLEHHAALRNDPAKSEEAARALAMVETTLDKMAAGGIHDHLAGGFHRYSVDDVWHVPHFEKMLYDQAQLAATYLDAHQLTGKEHYADVARGIFTYVERDLSHPDGPFYSAEDADSLIPEGHPVPEHLEKSSEAASGSSGTLAEGAFYLWTTPELEEVLGADTAAIFTAAYSLRNEGNAPAGSDPFHEFTGRNILYRAETDAALAAAFDRPEKEIRDLLARARESLLAVRAQRPRPSLDDKILTAWNALMISAYAKAHNVLANDSPPNSPAGNKTNRSYTSYKSSPANAAASSSPFLDRAIRAATFLKENLYDPKTKTLLRAYRDGPSDIPAFADDYAFFIQALLDLYESSQDTAWLEFALDLQDRQFALLLDSEHGGFFDSPADRADLILRLKNTTDGARPSANSISALNLLRFSTLLKSSRHHEELEKILHSYAAGLRDNPLGHIALLTTAARRLQSPAQIVVAGPPAETATRDLLAAIQRRYLPNKILLFLDGGPHQDFLARKNDLFAAFKPIEGRPTLYLCRNFACQKPTNDPKEIAAQLDQL